MPKFVGPTFDIGAVQATNGADPTTGTALATKEYVDTGSRPITSVTGTTTLTHLGSQLVKVDTSAGALTVNLPDATLCSGAEIVFTKITSDHNAATVLAATNQSIKGSPAGVFLVSRSDFLRLESDGSTDWRVVAIPSTAASSYQAPQNPRLPSRTDAVTSWGRLWISEMVRWAQRTQITPATPTAATATTGGTLAGGQTLGYRITALNANGGETAASAAVRISIPSGTNTNTVTISWSAVSANNGTAATGYKIYGRASTISPSDFTLNSGYTGSKFLAQVGAVTSWVDTGSATPGAAASGIDTTQAALMVGEIGFPSGAVLNWDVADWEAMAERMLWDFDSYQIPTLWWDVNDQNNPVLSLYTRTIDGDMRFGNLTLGDPNTVTSVGSLYERHPDWAGSPFLFNSYFRGVNVSNGSYGAAYNLASITTFSNTRVDGTGGSSSFGFPTQNPQPPDGPQQTGTFYNYGSKAFYNYLASRGISTVAICFNYERLFRTSDLIGTTARINSTEGSRLDAAIAGAGDAGLNVILRAFGNGNYYLDNGSTAGVAQTVDAAATITAMTNSGTTVTATVAAASQAQMFVGLPISVAGATGLTNVNGTWTVASIVGTTQFTFTVTTTPTGTYTASSASVMTYTNTAYANFWTQIATRYSTTSNLLGYYFDNEPPGFSSNMTVTTWKATTQAAVTAIRAIDTTKNVYVPLYPESCNDPMLNISAGAWISDTTNKVVYTGHFYADGSGVYSSSYKNVNFGVAASGNTALGSVANDDLLFSTENLWLRTTALPSITSADPTLTLFSGDNGASYTFKAETADHLLHVLTGTTTLMTLASNGVFVAFGTGAAWAVQDRSLSGTTHQWYYYATGGTWALFSSNSNTNILSVTEGTWDLDITTGNLDIQATGKGVKVKEGSNCKQGTATLASGTVVVSNTSVTASSRIFLTAQDNSSTGALRVSARTAGTSFTITSSNAGDSGVVAYEIFEPG